MTKTNKLKLLDLFSGIGGFSLGFEMTNKIQTIAFCEKDKFCQKVLAKHWNNIKIYDDIRKLNGKEIRADIITGGFPCQPFSVAGKRKGTDDDRYLWDETIRVIAETKPRWFVGENVDGLINIANGTILQQIQKDLEAENFQVQCLVIPASGIGAWHQRKRVWIIGYSNSNANAKAKQRSNGKKNSLSKEYWSKNSAVQFAGGTNNNNVSNSNTLRRQNETRYHSQNGQGQEEMEINEPSSVCKVQSNVPNSDSRLCGGRGAELKSGDDREWWFCSKEEEQTRDDIRSKTVGCNALFGKEENATNSNVEGLERHRKKTNRLQIQTRKFAKKNSEREQRTMESWWQTQSKLCGVPNGISYELDKDRTNRIKSLGNSIVPQIAYEIAKAIIEAETYYENT